jgi:hypothetical protein
MIVSDATIVSAFVLEPYPVHPSFSAYLVEFISGQIFPVWQNPRTGAYRAYNRKQPTVRNAAGEPIQLAAEVAPGSTVNIAVHMDDTALSPGRAGNRERCRSHAQGRRQILSPPPEVARCEAALGDGGGPTQRPVHPQTAPQQAAQPITPPNEPGRVSSTVQASPEAKPPRP